MMVGWDMIVMAFGLSLSAWLPFHLSVVSEAVRLSRGLARDVDPDLPDHETLALSSLGDCRLEGFLCSILSGVVAMVVSFAYCCSVWAYGARGLSLVEVSRTSPAIGLCVGPRTTASCIGISSYSEELGSSSGLNGSSNKSSCSFLRSSSFDILSGFSLTVTARGRGDICVLSSASDSMLSSTPSCCCNSSLMGVT
jgi:hypothetical protein